MFGLGPAEIAIVAIIAVLLFGSKLPQVAANIGRSIPSFKKGIREVESEIKEIEKEVKNLEKV